VFVYVCVCFSVCVQVEALRWANHPSKEPYRLTLIKKLRKLSPMLQSGTKLPSVGATRKKKNSLKYRIWLYEPVQPTSLHSISLRNVKGKMAYFNFILLLFSYSRFLLLLFVFLLYPLFFTLLIVTFISLPPSSMTWAT
jgi:hypothetical protein